MRARKLRDRLMLIIEEGGVQNGTDKAVGALLYEVAAKVSFPCMFFACR